MYISLVIEQDQEPKHYDCFFARHIRRIGVYTYIYIYIQII